MLAHDLAKKLQEGPNYHVVMEDDEIYHPTGNLAVEEVVKWTPTLLFPRSMSKKTRTDEVGIKVVVIGSIDERSKDW